MQLFLYNATEVKEIKHLKLSEIDGLNDVLKTTWINVHGLNNPEIIDAICQKFNADNFIVGDILNTTKRTKLEEYQDILFFNVKSLLPLENSDTIGYEQISFILKDNVLLSFQEKRSDFFTHIRERILSNSGVIRTKKADYLLYLLLDAIIENFYITIETEEENVDKIITLSKTSTQPEVLEMIEKHRDNFNFLKARLFR